MRVVEKTEGNCCGGCVEVTLKLDYNDLEKLGYKYFSQITRADDQTVLKDIKKLLTPARKPRAKKDELVPAFAMSQTIPAWFSK